MVNIISLDKLEQQPLKTKTTTESNIDFLEVLLKNIESTKSDKTSLKDEMNDIKEKIKSKDDKLDKMLDDMLEHLEKPQTLTLFNQLDKDKNFIKEIKDIISTKIKQDNVLLSKQEIKEFKKFDNLKDLLNFADKKLNIKEIKFDIAKTIKKHIDLDLKKDIKPKITPKTNEIIKQQITKTEKPIIEKKDIKDNKPKISLNDVLNENKKTKNVKIENIEEKKALKEIKIKDKTIKTEEKKDIKVDNKITNANKDSKLKQDNVLLSKQEVKNDTKKETITLKNQKNQTQHTIKETNKTNKIDLNSLLNKDKKTDDKIIKPKSHIQTNSEIINNNIPINEIKNRIVSAKQTIESFKNNLDEAIKNYKPPISKVNIELNPKNLGKVEVSIIQRGNNIQVHLNSDPNNINLFQTHQAEFRQALSNIGFSNIDMSFNQNKDERKRNQAKKAYEENDEIKETADIEIKANYKYA